MIMETREKLDGEVKAGTVLVLRESVIQRHHLGRRQRRKREESTDVGLMFRSLTFTTASPRPVAVTLTFWFMVLIWENSSQQR